MCTCPAIRHLPCDPVAETAHLQLQLGFGSLALKVLAAQLGWLCRLATMSSLLHCAARLRMELSRSGLLVRCISSQSRLLDRRGSVTAHGVDDRQKILQLVREGVEKEEKTGHVPVGYSQLEDFEQRLKKRKASSSGAHAKASSSQAHAKAPSSQAGAHASSFQADDKNFERVLPPIAKGPFSLALFSSGKGLVSWRSVPFLPEGSGCNSV